MLKRFVGIALLAAALLVLTLQRNALSLARQENEQLRHAQDEVVSFKTENASIPVLHEENRQIAALRDANADLLKLRNDVRTLRESQPQVAKLRQENHRLESEIKLLSEGKPLRLSEMDGYVAKESWSNAGFATPEAALQTFFWAIREERFGAIAQCFAPEYRLEFERAFAKAPLEEKTKAFEQFAKMTGYRIAETEHAPATPQEPDALPDRITLRTQASAGGAVIKWRLKRFGDEWKIEDL